MVRPDPSLRFVVYSHCSRRDFAERLAAQLPVGTIVHLDSGSGVVSVNCDCLRLYSSGVEYLCLLEDDVLLCDRFEESVERALRATSGDHIVSLFSMSGETAEALAAGATWIVSHSMQSCLANVYPTKLIPRLLLHAPRTAKNFDDVVSSFLWATGTYVWQAIPNFVQHRELPSTCGNPTRIGGRRRITRCFGSGADVDFAAGYAHPVPSKVQVPRAAYVKLGLCSP